MRIFILTMDDPLYTLPFIKQIIEAKKNSIVGLAVTKADRLTIGRGKSKFLYVMSLALIMGLPFFLRNTYVTILFKIRKKFSKYGFWPSPSIINYARKEGIKTYELNNPNDDSFLPVLIQAKPDIIINQSQSILKARLLSIPTVGTLNRHNALLPKNRGRLTPFWVLYKNEKLTGVSIHFVEEGIDSGPIVLQEEYKICRKDSFRSLVIKNYKIAPKLMLKAISLLEKGNKEFIDNDDKKATYNTTPTLKEAWLYRKGRILGIFKSKGSD